MKSGAGIFPCPGFSIQPFFIPKFKISIPNLNLRFERYVNFEFYKTALDLDTLLILFERYVNFEFYKTVGNITLDNACLRDM